MKKIWIAYLFAGICAWSSCIKKNDATGGPVIPPPPPPPPPPSVQYKNFYVQGRTLKDSADQTFVMRGNNFPVFWFPTQYKPALKAASSLGSNSARLVWQLQQQAWTPTLAVLDEALAECVAQKLVPIVELHDFTGGNNAADITQAVAWFTRADVKAVMDKYAHVVILNIANEWGSGSLSELSWKNAYLPAIGNLRAAGYKMPIMIDAPGYGQNENAVVQYGLDLLNADPLKNIIFAVHAYSNWNTSSSYAARINAMLAKNLCIVFGEFGWDVPAAQQPTDFVCKVNAPLLMQLCQQNGIGYLGWSWMGNNAANACFDMSTSWSDTTNLTTWGKQWAYDVNGVKNTGRKATAF